LNMLFDIPIVIGALLTVIFVIIMLFSNTYHKIEKWIIAFVSIIGISFIYELTLVDIDWNKAGMGWVAPKIPSGSIIIIMSVLGAVVMPHNLFLHSEVIQSRQWNLQDEKTIKKQLDYELFDTLFSMIVGWAINSAMILLAASTFFVHNIKVDELQQAKNILVPLLGNNASTIFAVALLLAGIASSITSSMAAGSIFAGIYKEPYDPKDNHSKIGIGISLIAALAIIMFISNPYYGLIISQMILSIQLPFTIFLQVYLTSSKKVMGKYANKKITNIVLIIIGSFVTYLNFYLLFSYLF